MQREVARLARLGATPLVHKAATREEAHFFANNGRTKPVKVWGKDHFVVHTHGVACPRTSASSAVFFGWNHPLNTARTLRSAPFSNARAELYAIYLALSILTDPRKQPSLPSRTEKPHVVITTRSNYVKGALTEWRPKWEESNFKNGSITNRNLVRKTWEMMDSFETRSGLTLKIVYCGDESVTDEFVETRQLAECANVPPP